MDQSTLPLLREKEYLTIEQRKVVNWYRRVFQIRDTALLVLDFTPLHEIVVALNELGVPNTEKFCADNRVRLREMAKDIALHDVNASALDLFGYADIATFRERELAAHFPAMVDLLTMLLLAMREGRQHVEIETLGCSAHDATFKLVLELIVPSSAERAAQVICSVAGLSDIEQLAINQFGNAGVYASFVDQAPVCIHEIDPDGRLQSMNAAGLAMMEVDDFSEIQGQYYLDLVSPEDRQRIETLLQRAHEGYSSEFEFSLTIRNSQRMFTSCFIPMAQTSAGRRRIVGVTQDITERKQSEETLYRFANFDALTRLRNRPNFLDAAAGLLARANQHAEELAVLFIDLDDFKPINDQHGHEAGDRVLQEVAHRLHKVLSDSDLISRFGGDEFVIMLPLTSRQQAEVIAQRLLQTLHHPMVEAGLTASVQASIGISCFPRDAATLKALIRAADEAMYEAKRAGGGQWQFYPAVPAIP